MNLIIITVDALRKETLKCYNEKEGVSVGFEDFYKRGMVFDHMFTTIPQTYGALGSLFTGLYPFNHKIAIEPYDRSKLILFDYLKDTHSILLFTTEPPLGESLTYKEYEEYNLELEGKGRVDLRKSPIDVSRLLNYMEENKERDFFFTTHIWTTRRYGTYKENDFQKLIAEKRYSEVWQGSLKLVEEVGVAINKIYLALKRLHLLDKTIVVIASDHGDYFVSDHPVSGFHPPRPERKSGCGHGSHYNLEANIPFILYHPEIVPKRFSQIFSIVDILPTLLSFLDKTLKTKTDGINRDGFLRGKEKFTPKDVFIDRIPTCRIYTLIDPEGWKLTYIHNKFYLYNIFRDLEESNDLAEERLDIVEKLYKKLHNYPINIFIRKKDIIFRYLNYWNIDHVKEIFDKFGLDDWKEKAPFFEKVKWVTDPALLNAITDQILSQRDSKVLEIGIGTGILSKKVKKLYPSFSVTGIDLSPSMLSFIKKEDNIVIRTGDAHRLSFTNESFDVILMRGVLHYLEEPLQVFREASRVLKKDGVFILCEETAQSEYLFPIWKKMNIDALFYKNDVYSREEIKEFLLKTGFSNIIKKEILFYGYSLNNYLSIYNRHEKVAIKRRYHDSSSVYKECINFYEEADIRSGQPYGDVSVNINFSIFKGKKN